MMTTPSQHAPCNILLNHVFGESLSLNSTGIDVWRIFFSPSKDIPSNSVISRIATQRIRDVSEKDLTDFTTTIHEHLDSYHFGFSELPFRIRSYLSLCSVARDWTALRESSRTFNLQAWSLNNLEAEIGRPLSEDTRGILKPNTSCTVHTPFCFREYVEVCNAAETLEGELCYNSLIAVPLARLAVKALKRDNFPNPIFLSTFRDRDRVSAPYSAKPHLLLSVEAYTVLCAAVKPSHGAIEVAWQEAIDYSMLLPIETNHCTMVMGVGGDRVRIGLMTLESKKETVTHNEDLFCNVSSQHAEAMDPLPELPLDLRVAIQAANILPYEDTVRDRDILYGIQFCAPCVSYGVFDTTIGLYFAFLLGIIKREYNRLRQGVSLDRP